MTLARHPSRTFSLGWKRDDDGEANFDKDDTSRATFPPNITNLRMSITTYPYIKMTLPCPHQVGPFDPFTQKKMLKEIFNHGLRLIRLKGPGFESRNITKDIF